MKKILILTHNNSNDIGGIESYTNNLINIFTSNNIFVYEINIYSSKQNLNQNNKKNYNFVYTKYFDKLNFQKDLNLKTSKNIFKKLVFYIKAYICELQNGFFIKKFTKKENIDIVINNNYSTPLFFNKKTKYIWVQHFDHKVYMISLWKRLFRNFLGIKNPLTYPNIVFFSENDYNHFLLNKKIKNNTVPFFISPSISKSNFDHLNRKPIKIAFVGRLDNFQKNINFLNDITSLSNKKNKPILIDVYGKGKDEYLLRNNPNIILHGYLNSEEMNKEYLSIKLLLLPSKFEGFPITIVEALNNGIPCIIANTYLNASYLINSDRGSLINNFDPEEWLNEIYKFLNLSDDKYFEISKNCYEFALKDLSLNNFKNKWLNLLETIAS